MLVLPRNVLATGKARPMATLLRETERGSDTQADVTWRGDDDPLSACVGIAGAAAAGACVWALLLILI
jgi:hypothetical protein